MVLARLPWRSCVGQSYLLRVIVTVLSQTSLVVLVVMLALWLALVQSFWMKAGYMSKGEAMSTLMRVLFGSLIIICFCLAFSPYTPDLVISLLNAYSMLTH